MYLKVKTIVDPILALILLAALSPVLLVIAILIRLDSPGEAIFIQKRLGLHGHPFDFYKFRSMTVNAESMGSGVYSYTDDPRVTRIGRFLRRSSLDELPQLWNIVKGEMSFIGPRPVLVQHPWPYEEYSEQQKIRFTVKPGLTGLAQIRGRKTLKWKDRISHDLEYVQNLSLLTDLKILLATVKVLLTNEGNNNTQTTDEKEDK